MPKFVRPSYKTSASDSQWQSQSPRKRTPQQSQLHPISLSLGGEVRERELTAFQLSCKASRHSFQLNDLKSRQRELVLKQKFRFM